MILFFLPESGKTSEISNLHYLTQRQCQLFADLSLLLVGQTGDWRGFSPVQVCSAADLYLLGPEIDDDSLHRSLNNRAIIFSESEPEEL